VTCGSESRAENRDCLSQLLLPRKQKFPQFCSSPLGITKAQAFFTLPYSVNYTALAVKGVPYTHEASAILSVLAKFIEQKRVHPEIREKGGAYGGSVRYNALDGIFSFSSYRDPSFERSLQIMQEAGEWVLKQEIDGKTLGEMKLSIFKDLDSPISVQQEGMARFLHGITRTMGKRYSPNFDITNRLDGDVLH
jgi:presequence protease